jgi:acylphosphatase
MTSAIQGAHEGVEPHVAGRVHGAGYRYAQRHQTESAGLASLALIYMATSATIKAKNPMT